MLRILMTILLPGALLGAVSNRGCSTPKNGGQPQPNRDTIYKTPVEPERYGVVKAVDAVARTIILSVESDGKKQEKTYELAQDAKILLDGPSKLADLTAGLRVGLVYDSAHKAVVEVRSEPFHILIKPKKNRIVLNKPFEVELRVVNVSASPQSFQVMSCSWYDNWKASNSRVASVPWACHRNGPTPIKLAPGKAYEKILPMLIKATGPVSFKMGFTPVGSNRTYWSSEVTLEVNQGQDK